MSLVEKMSHFKMLMSNFWNGKIITDLHIKAADRHQYLHYTSRILTTLKGP